MRTTLTLDEDVAAMLEQLRKARGDSLKHLVNEALRAGLKQVAMPPKRREQFRTTSADLGPCLLGNVDSLADILAVVEGESYK